MEWTFLKAFAAGSFLFLPMGPVGIYCVGKTLAAGRKEGFASAIGAVSVDVIYGVVAFLFLAQVSHVVKEYQLYFKILVSISLMIIGWKKTREKVKKKVVESKGNLIGDYLTTFYLSFANVPNIFSMIGIFTLLNLFEGEGSYSFLLLALGIAASEILLWSAATYYLNKFRERVNENVLTKIVRISGAILMAFGFFIGIGEIIKRIS